MASRPERIPGVERLIGLGIAVLLAVGAGDLLWWHLSTPHMVLLGIGLASLLFAWMVGRYGLIGYSRESGTTSVTESPIPRGVLAPLLVVVGAAFIVAATNTPVGRAVDGPAEGAVWLYQLAAATWNFVLVTALVLFGIGTLGVAVLRRDWNLAVGAGILVGLLGVAFGLGYLLYRVGVLSEEQYRDEWDKFLQPVRVVIDLFG